MPTGAALSATPSATASSTQTMPEATSIAATPVVTGSSVMKAIGAATVAGGASMTPVANGVYSVTAAVDYEVILPVVARLFWEREADASTSWADTSESATTWTDTSDSSITWTDKSDDTKP
jgi:hypothetical protein